MLGRAASVTLINRSPAIDRYWCLQILITSFRGGKFSTQLFGSRNQVGKRGYNLSKALEEYKEALELGIRTVPVFVGPVSYLLMSKPTRDAPKEFDPLSLLDSLLPVYNKYGAFKKAYDYLGADFGATFLIETYFADLPADAYKTLIRIESVRAIGVDLVRGTKTLEVIKEYGLPEKKKLLAGVLDGRNIWANKLHEVVALSNALKRNKDEEFFAANASAQASRKNSPRVHNTAVQEAIKNLGNSDHRRATPVVNRLEEQQKKLNLPILPTITIGSFPQTIELRRVRREVKSKKSTEEEYIKAIQTEIQNVVKLQEELDLDVLVHGEPERNDMVENFGEQLQGFVFTANGWVQSYGSRCVKPPVIFGDVSRPSSMTVFWSKYAQSLTSRPMRVCMLTGPVTILNWSFVRNDQPRSATCLQIALAIKDEVEDLEANGVTVIQIDEAALREGLPLRKSEQAAYQDWAVHSFRITTCGVKDTITIENSRSDEKLLSVFREGVKYAAGIGPGVYDLHSPRIPPTEEMADRARKLRFYRR
ncbi:hypothetical protein R1sor_002434 [Riccia sorocarpa]|uniref:5-methyltetrahydropteroyltriglutamate--homocysteine S-methyltransferase n=1 Tax=Riccia sorocarpa TaxID=122646 RepID=A0ABD3H1Y6_9MARC